MRLPAFYPARAKGNHLAAQNDEPEPHTESELIEGEKQRSAFSMDWEQDRAMQEQIRMFRAMGVM